MWNRSIWIFLCIACLLFNSTSASGIDEEDSAILILLSDGDVLGAAELINKSHKGNAIYENILVLYQNNDKATFESSLTFLSGRAKKGEVLASRTLADYYYYHEKDRETAQSWYRLAASQGDSISEMTELVTEIFVNKDESRITELKALADEGYISAAYNLGIFYNKKGDLESKKLARSYFKYASQYGHAKATYNMAVYYKQDGDIESYMKLLSDSADKGFWSARFQYGVELYRGRYIERDIPKFIEYMEVLSEEGVTKASVGLGSYYNESAKTIEDYEKTEIYYSRAAYAGNEEVLEWLIVYYEHRLAHEVNEAMAQKLKDMKLLFKDAKSTEKQEVPAG